MLKIGQNLALDSKTAQDFLGICASFEDFDRDALFKLSVSALGKVNGSHTAASKFVENLVCTDSLSNSIAFVLPEPCCHQLSKFFKKSGIMGQEPFSVTEECCIVCARCSEHRRPTFS